MNESTNPNQNPNPENESAQSGPQGAYHTRSFTESVRSAWNDGAERARAAAQEAVPKIKAALNDTGYWASYGASFAAAFTTTLAKEFAPESLKKGGYDGAQAGKKAAEDFANQRKSSPSQNTGGAPPDLGTVVITS